jgi:hypothetical protein
MNFKTKKKYPSKIKSNHIWSYLIIVVAIACVFLSSILALFVIAINITLNALEEGIYMPGRDTVEWYKEGKYEILRGDNENSYAVCDNSLKSSPKIILENIKKWQYVSICSCQYICAIDEKENFYILNLESGELQAPSYLDEIPKEFVRTYKSLRRDVLLWW